MANYTKKYHLELLKKARLNELTDPDLEQELLLCSIVLYDQLTWEMKDQFIDLIEKFLDDSISSPEFFAELRIKKYSLIDAVGFLISHEILLSPHRKSKKFGQLLEPIFDFLEGDLEPGFEDSIRTHFIKIKNYLKED